MYRKVNMSWNKSKISKIIVKKSPLFKVSVKKGNLIFFIIVYLNKSKKNLFDKLITNKPH